jgi:DNA-directed RNA polymerase specialized sigma24 family protein
MTTSFSRDYFPSTNWSVINNAGNSQSPLAESALNELCFRYREPLYVFARHGGAAHANAEDLVQGFFSYFLKKNYLQGLNREKGRFRAFLLKCFKHYSCNKWKGARCQKRGGGADHLPLDWVNADEKFPSQLMATGTPERMYDRACAITLLNRVLARLCQEMQAEGKSDRFEALKPGLTVDRDEFDYRTAASRLKLSEGATRKVAERLRERYGELIIQEIRETCGPAQVEEEMWSLLNAFSD